MHIKIKYFAKKTDFYVKLAFLMSYISIKPANYVRHLKIT